MAPDLELLVTLVDLGVVRGDTNAWQVAITRGDEGVDLTGGEAWFTAKYDQSLPDEQALFQKTIGDGIDVLDAPGGILQIMIAPEDTASIMDAEQPVYYDLQIREIDGRTTTLVKGRLLIDPDITRS